MRQIVVAVFSSSPRLVRGVVLARCPSPTVAFRGVSERRHRLRYYIRGAQVPRAKLIVRSNGFLGAANHHRTFGALERAVCEGFCQRIAAIRWQKSGGASGMELVQQTADA
jgi:hypothetical protein